MSRWLEKQREREAAEAAVVVATEIKEAVEQFMRTSGSQFKPSEFRPGDKYRWTSEDTVADFYELARRMNTNADTLMHYNEIEDFSELEAGIDIYCPPLPHSAENKPKITYELLPEPRDMHIVKKGGAKKWAFGNVRTWEDFQSNGFYPEHTNLQIVAIAHVPVEDEKNPEAAFYLDNLSLGDYAVSGRVRYTVGYRWKDLADGVYVPVQTAEPKEDKLAAKKAFIEEMLNDYNAGAGKAMDIHPAPINTPQEEPEQDLIDRRLADLYSSGAQAFKASYQTLAPSIVCTAYIPDDVGEVDDNGQAFIWVKDFDNRRPNRKLYHLQKITITGTFEVDDIVVGRPEKSAHSGLWFGIPMDFLRPMDQVYNVGKVEAAERLAKGRLTTLERYFWVPMAKFVHKRISVKKTNNVKEN